MKSSIVYFLILLSISISAQDIQQLSGTVIGSSNSFDYGANSCSESVNTIQNVFDGDLTTYFAACERTGGWVGLDLGTAHVISQIAYCPRPTQPGRLLLGLFEGANSPDFGDAMPLFMIKDQPEQGQLTTTPISHSKGFRYVRYIGPDNVKCNIAEVAFYGYVGQGDNSTLYQITQLPTLVINTVGHVDITSKDYYLSGVISVISNEKDLYVDSLEIKGRGNASWEFPKRPYRLKLYNKASLLKLPAKEKNWTLINNYGDKTLMRNYVAFRMSQLFEMPYTPAAEPVDVILNGQYKGSYQLSDQMEVATHRIEIDKMKPTDITLPTLSGGYLLEVDAYANQEISWFTSSRNRTPVTVKYPKDDEIVPTQYAYIKGHYNALENVAYSADYKSPTSGFRRYMDVNSFLKHFLIGELSGNTDTYWSVYMYKLRADDKFYFGPVWDFDIAFENDYRTYPINQKTDFIYNSQGSSANGFKDLVNRLMSDPSMRDLMKDIWSDTRNDKGLTSDGLLGYVEQMAQRLEASQQLNFMRWPILNTKVHMNPATYGSYRGEVDNLKSYIANRILWMDRKVGLHLPSAIGSVAVGRIYVQGRTLMVSDQPEGSLLAVYAPTGQLVYRGFAPQMGEILLPQSGLYVVHCIWAEQLQVHKVLVL